MTAQHVVADILLGLAALVVLAASVGIVVMPDAYAKLHFVSPATLVAPALVTLAVFVQSGLTSNSGESVMALVFLMISGPFLSHATIRALRLREGGDWRQPAPSHQPAEEREQ